MSWCWTPLSNFNIHLECTHTHTKQLLTSHEQLFCFYCNSLAKVCMCWLHEHRHTLILPQPHVLITQQELEIWEQVQVSLSLSICQLCSPPIWVIFLIWPEREWKGKERAGRWSRVTKVAKMSGGSSIFSPNLPVQTRPNSKCLFNLRSVLVWRLPLRATQGSPEGLDKHKFYLLWQPTSNYCIYSDDLKPTQYRLKVWSFLSKLISTEELCKSVFCESCHVYLQGSTSFPLNKEGYVYILCFSPKHTVCIFEA